MAEARALTRRRSVWQKTKDFLAAHTISSMGGLLFLFFAIFLLWPSIMVLVKSVYGPEGFTLEYYKAFVDKGYYYQSLYNTLLLGLIVTLLCLGITFCFIYMTTRGPTYLRTPLKVFALLPLITPSYMYALSLIILLGRNGIITKALNLSWSIYGFPGCIIAQTMAYIPLAYLITESTMISLNPNLEESAANLGATEGKILRSITIPLLAPGLLKAALIVFAQTITAFGNIELLRGRVPFLAPDAYIMVVGAEHDLNMSSVLSTFLILLCVVVFIVQNYLLRGGGYATILGKPVTAEPKRMGPGILIPMLAVCSIACVFVVLTFGVVAVGAFTKLIGINNELTLLHILDMTCNPAIINSVKISLLTGLFGAMMGLLLAYVIVRGKFRGRAALEAMVLVAFAFPGTAMGIGYILAFNRPPLLLTGTFIILALNSLVRMLAVGVEAGISKLQQLSIEVEEASLNLGAGIITTFRRIVFPIIFPAFIYGFLYVFIRTMKTLSALIFLVSPGNPMFSIYIFDKTYDGELGRASAASLKLMVIVGACVALLQYLSKWTGLSVTRKA